MAVVPNNVWVCVVQPCACELGLTGKYASSSKGPLGKHDVGVAMS